MSGILRERNEILKIQAEFKELKNKPTTPKDKAPSVEVPQVEELVLETCEL